MSNVYTKTSFAFVLQAAEASLLREALVLAAALDGSPSDEEMVQAWDITSQTFKDRFPPRSPDEPLSGFLAIFSDPDFPSFDAMIIVPPDDGGEGYEIAITSDQFDPETIANLLVAIVETNATITATWAETADRKRPDHFSGGGFRIEGGRIHWLVAASVRQPECFAPLFVLTTRDDEAGLLFWNETDGFGDLASATTFSEEEAKNQPAIIANDEPEWLRLPSAAYPHA